VLWILNYKVRIRIRILKWNTSNFGPDSDLYQNSTWWQKIRKFFFIREHIQVKKCMLNIFSNIVWRMKDFIIYYSFSTDISVVRVKKKGGFRSLRLNNYRSGWIQIRNTASTSVVDCHHLDLDLIFYFNKILDLMLTSQYMIKIRFLYLWTLELPSAP